MEDNLKDLQSLIAEKAEKRLEADLDEFSQKFREHKFIEGFKSVYVKVPGEGVVPDRTENIATIFWTAESFALSKLREVLLPKYVEEETKQFVERVYKIDSPSAPKAKYSEEEELEDERPLKKDLGYKRRGI